MIAEGYYHIKDKPDRVKEHLVKLACLTVVSEFAYDYMESTVLVLIFLPNCVTLLLIVKEGAKDIIWR